MIDRVGLETEAFHPQADEDALALSRAVRRVDYLVFLERTWGFLVPVERSLARTTGLEPYTDLRRFQKHELLRQDLEGFRLTADDIARLPTATVPLFGSPQEALGWAYVIERSTLMHVHLFRHLALALPGEVAFTSSYLKCYFGAIGESWKRFGDSVEAVAASELDARQVIDAATAGFRAHRAWRNLHDEQLVEDREGMHEQPA